MPLLSLSYFFSSPPRLGHLILFSKSISSHSSMIVLIVPPLRIFSPQYFFFHCHKSYLNENISSHLQHFTPPGISRSTVGVPSALLYNTFHTLFCKFFNLILSEFRVHAMAEIPGSWLIRVWLVARTLVRSQGLSLLPSTSIHHTSYSTIPFIKYFSYHTGHLILLQFSSFHH